jgi:hypothetical protein
MDIDKKILEETIRCAHNFGCLKDKNHACLLAKVECIVDNDFLIVKCPVMQCSYKSPFGHSFICKCPIRKEIYIKHKK